MILPSLKEKFKREFNLNGKNSFSSNQEENQNNPVPKEKKNKNKPRPGVYSIWCIKTNFIYYGEAEDLVSRISWHKTRIKKGICEIPLMLDDIETYSFEDFEFEELYAGPEMALKKVRQEKETELIQKAGEKTYNTISNTISQNKYKPRTRQFGLISNYLFSK